MTLKTMLAAVAVAALVPAAALADPAEPSDKANGARACQQLRTSLGVDTFKQTYGTNADRSNAFGKCVSGWTRAEHQNRHEAELACKAEQADAGFAASHDGKTFAQFYGLGKKGANALQRCINAKRSAETASEVRATRSAARGCKAERRTDAAAFRAKYGTNASKSNAFGKCVSALAEAKSD